MSENKAAWLGDKYADLKVGPAPVPVAGHGELVVRNRAIAVNPLDAVKQTTGNMMYSWLPYPSVLGEDLSGEVVEVGSGVTGFTIGDRVLAYAVGMEKSRNSAAEGAFQNYTVVLAKLTSAIPDDLTHEQAAVLPLALSTAASALFQRNQLGLQHPSVDAMPTGKTVLVWGGSTSVGSNAIQLAVAAGYDVITTASPKNHDYVRGLGASQVFDYSSDTAVDDLVAALAGAEFAGALAVGTGSAEPTVAVASRVDGRRRVVLASPSVSLGDFPRGGGMNSITIRMLSRLVWTNVALQVRARLLGVKAGFVWGSSLMNNEVAPAVFRDFLPLALAEGRYVAAPPARVVGHGLASVQSAIDALREGVSAQKLVVSL
ncbi:NADPH:quinone reductase-like Zn-dependent oxidoreductase [Microbacterium endophyticum]|uniref:NADPH:quinone reductase-like Zn-dependent oxidoreductase n=2 Tax=Microbacterium endophyticum TaxID=1526412 RepID=A0A7W4V1S0_9MICO|nr:zinc-binding alcohol dehydrogenase family protein [Microbacterium endophyticum]MBB2975240.1 NADPH:quinone reductase-like Zn-dependent oxidoreductase [Microbacterium endophyticum]NIK37548.1 NADPH:quinone reductase-like Zn-dependent oxidoreductase [Microbacterium endophyticum]